MEQLLNDYFSHKNPSEIRTPIYLYFPNQLSENICKFEKFIKYQIPVFYAIKANNYTPLVIELIKNGFGFDVASRQELEFVINLGAAPAKITFSAPTKKNDDLIHANKIGIKYYAFDSEEELQKICSIVDNPILFARIAAFNKEAVFDLSSKFGMNESYLKYILKKAKKKRWPIKGITFHVGSQNISLNSWKIALKHVGRIIKLAHQTGIQIKYVNMGGGIPVQYSKKIAPIETYIDQILNYALEFRTKYPQVELFIEPGRAMCANTMALITRIIDLKPYKKPPILIVDTGVFNGIIEPIENFEYPVFCIKDTSIRKRFYKIAGFSCEGFDIIKSKALLPNNIKIGDFIAFMHSGAYTFVYNNFHMVPYPEIQTMEPYEDQSI